MKGITHNMAMELADTWDAMASADSNPSPLRRETLRECADLLRMLADLTTLESGGFDQK